MAPHESSEVRLARIEEGMFRLHDKMSTYHSDIMKAIGPIKESVEKHESKIIILDRDRFWLFTIAAFIITSVIGTASYALIERMK